jgi:polyhydroxyalkanoate synthesis regulator phasin
MAKDDLIKRLLDAGLHATQMTQSRAEALAKDLVKHGDLRKKEAESLVKELVERGREGSERIVTLVQTEVAAQVAKLAQQVDALEERLADLSGRMKSAGDSAVSAARAAGASATGVAANAPAEKAAKKAPAKKSAAKKAPAKKAPAKKSAAKAAAPRKVAMGTKKAAVTPDAAPAVTPS